MPIIVPIPHTERRLLKHLKATYRRAKSVTLIVDNNIIRKSRETQRWLKGNPKFRVIYQPVYSPWVNHVERLWQALHDTITRKKYTIYIRHTSSCMCIGYTRSPS